MDFFYNLRAWLIFAAIITAADDDVWKFLLHGLVFYVNCQEDNSHELLINSYLVYLTCLKAIRYENVHCKF